MCTSIALTISELPLSLIEEAELEKRIYDRGGEKEVRFYWEAIPTVLPVWWNGGLHIVPWGNKDRNECKLPATGWTWLETIEEGKWSSLAPEPVVIPATYGFADGVWYRVKQGMRGLVVLDRAGKPVVFMLCQPATRYYRVMTRAVWMPVLIDEVI
jgi:hypothetical protein